MRTLKQVNADLRECRAEMRARGIKRTSCFNGGLSADVYRFNARMFALENERESIVKRGKQES